MTYKQIEASRERRLWFTQVILPAIGLGWWAMRQPDINFKVKTKLGELKQRFKDRIQKW